VYTYIWKFCDISDLLLDDIFCYHATNSLFLHQSAVSSLSAFCNMH